LFKIDEGSVLQHPGVCLICGSQPTKGEYAIDTEVLFVDPAAKHLAGHKYVCQKCAEEIAPLVPDKIRDRLKKENASLKSNYGALVAALDGLTASVSNVSD
jgi:hypothetical protein